MCCWILLGFAFAPRVALVFMWLFTNRISTAFGGIILPLIGFLLVPWATLAYTLLSPGGVNLFEMAVVVIAGGIDLGLWGGGAKRRRSR